MKTLTKIAVLLTLTVSIATAQVTPEMIDKYIGTKVGTGLCYELALQINKDYHKQIKKRFHKDEWDGRKLKKGETPIVGDLIRFHGVEYYDGERNGSWKAASHVAVIYKIISEGEYIIADQNGQGELKLSRVKLRRFSVSGVYEGKINYFTFQR